MTIKKAAVIGYPVSHSLSPEIHGYWINKYNIPATYGRVEIVQERLQHGVQQLKDSGYAGFNVTLPHKQDIMALCDHVDPVARAIGAVNTVIIDDGRLHGRNTDAQGFMQALCEGAPDLKLKGAKVLVLGAGGASRAVMYALKSAGVWDLRITNRTKSHAQDIGAAFGGEVIEWDNKEKSLQDIDLIVNTTSLGMKGKDDLVLDLSLLPAQAVVCDIVYNPRHTPLLQSAAARGNVTVEGLGMLLHQAAPAFEAWFGVRPEVTDELREKLNRILGS